MTGLPEPTEGTQKAAKVVAIVLGITILAVTALCGGLVTALAVSLYGR